MFDPFEISSYEEVQEKRGLIDADGRRFQLTLDVIKNQGILAEKMIISTQEDYGKPYRNMKTELTEQIRYTFTEFGVSFLEACCAPR